jgi:hypothetical protein
LSPDSEDGLDEEAVYGLDDSDSDEGGSSDDEGEEGDSEDALEEALLRGGRQAQGECGDDCCFELTGRHGCAESLKQQWLSGV